MSERIVFGDNFEDTFETEPVAPFPVSREPGIYFGLDESDYHADRACSASLSRNLLVSPLTAWTTSRFNPNYKDEPTDAQFKGKASHKLLVEGRKAFHEAYAVPPRKQDFPDALIDGADLKGYCETFDLKKSGTIAELCQRIREDNSAIELWPDIMAEFNDLNDDKLRISAEWYREIDTRAKIVAQHEDASRAFSGGYPEVSIFWRDEKTRAPMKSRIDYLKTSAMSDLKNFANMNGNVPEFAFMRSMMQYRLDVQAVIYLHAIQIAKTFTPDQVHGDVDMNWWAEVCKTKTHAFFFVGIQSGTIPDVVVREFKRYHDGETMEYFVHAWQSYRHALDEYCHCLRTYGDKPWIGAANRAPIVDHDFPVYFLAERN